MPLPTRGRIILAWVVVILTVIAVWKFVDYRNRPPAVIPWVVWAL
jgi:hypothetical protein